MPQVTFSDANKTVRVKTGSTVLDAAIVGHVELPHTCEGIGECSTCHIVIQEGSGVLDPVSEEEADLLEYVPNRQAASRMACMCRLAAKQHITVIIPEYPDEEDLTIRRLLAE